MMVIVARLQFDVATCCQLLKACDVAVNAAAADGENVDEFVLSPFGDIKPILATTCRSARNASCQQHRSALLLAHFMQHRPHRSHEIRDVMSQLPLFPQRQAGCVASGLATSCSIRWL